MYFEQKDNLIEYKEYYLIKENNAYKIIIGKIKEKNKIIIQSNNFENELNNDDLSKLLKKEFKNIDESFEYIINIFDNNKVYLKEIIVKELMRLILKVNYLNKEKEIEIDLIYNKEIKQLNITEIINNELKKDIENLKEEIKILKKEINYLKSLNRKSIIKDCKISKEINIDINCISKNDNSNPIYIQFLKDLTKDSYAHYALDNTFSIFKSINNILYIIYSNKKKSIISYNFMTNKKICEIKNAHNEYITNFRHYFDKINKLDLLISISSDDNNIKLWNINNWNIICNIKNINSKGSLHSACILNLKDIKKDYIITSNDNYNNSELIKLFDFNGIKIKEINDSNNRTFFIDTFYDNKLKKVFILTGNCGYIKSYDYNENKVYHKYSDINDNNNNDNENDINAEDHDCIIIMNNDNIVKIIESSEDGKIRIWDFHSGYLLNKIFVSEHKLYGICLWNKDYIFVASDDKTLKLIDLEKKIIINNLMENSAIINIKKIFHPKYGNCLVTQDWRNQIKLWINKN